MTTGPILDVGTNHHRFRFAAEPALRPISRLFGVDDRSCVEIVGTTLRARYGPWRIETALENVTGAEITGPYAWFKVAGPARYAAADRSLTFATNRQRGVAISFAVPIRGLDPWGIARHPSLTVTVEEPEALVDAIRTSRARTDEIVRDETDRLDSMTAHELRSLAREHGVRRASRLKKDELVAALSDLLA